MKISPKTAQRVVVEIGNIVGQNINMMDEQGHIIASTDPLRVGEHHEGACQIIQQNLPELYITPEEATSTMRQGLNLPILHGRQVVGVIGITGGYEEVVGYGQVVKRMTEILIREGTEQENRRLDARMRSRFLEDWVLVGTLLQGQGQTLVERGLLHGIDIALPRRVMVASIQELDRYIDTTAGQKLIAEVETAVESLIQGEPGSIILRNAARQILLVRARSEEQMAVLAGQVSARVADGFGVKLAIGIDGTASDVHRAYIQANTAWRSAAMARDGICAYAQVTLELFVGQVSKGVKEEYIRKVFKGCSYEELCQWVRILEAYFAAEGAITAAARALFMHKNTLQSKLKKLEALTGYDVRLPSQSTIFYMALLFLKEIGGSLAILGD